MFMLHLQLNHISSDLTIFFLHKQPLSLITYSLLRSARRPVKALFHNSIPLLHCDTVWKIECMDRSFPGQTTWVAMSRDSITPLSGPRHSRLRFQTSGSWSVSEQGINLLWHTDSPLGGRPALGSSPTAVPIAARVMQGVREAGMDGGTGYGGMEVNGQKEGECWDAGSAEERRGIWEGIRGMECGIEQIRTIG